MVNEAFLVGGVRTPVGRYGGALAEVRGDDLAALVVGEVVRRTGIPADRIDDVVMGAANQAGEDNRNVARMAVLLSGLPDSVPGYTVNRLCASGLQAIASAAQSIRAGDTALSVAGGAESMTRAPWVTGKPARAWAKPGEVFDTALGWRLVNPRMKELDGGDATLGLGECTEKLASLYGITRDAADEYAVRSQALAAAAWDRGDFDNDIVAVPTKSGDFTRDETVRPGTTIESLAKLKPAFTREGVSTAGNSSPLSDGASAIVVAGQRSVDEHGLAPRARIVSYAVAGVAPSLFGIGPVPAIRKALDAAGLSLADMDAVDINEAFAAQVLSCEKELGLDRERLNPSGGAIALGHPLGSSGSRIVISLLGHLERTGGRYGVASLCIGVGQGAAMVIERL
ncbi:MAG: thiolase family protein [Actinomycetota bacterium]|nr:thiolase family protein [Actinomycetota bacterium]